MEAKEPELEKAWLDARRPRDLSALLDGRGVTSPRKSRLAACACLRQIWGLFSGPSRLVVEAAERYADKLIDSQELRQAREFWASSGVERLVCETDAKRCLEQTLERLTNLTKFTPYEDRYVLALRDVFGNPFRPAALEPYRNHDLIALAEGMYSESAFERMDIFADALEDAGCTELAILDHCRTPGGHWRGCWVIDGILGKS